MVLLSSPGFSFSTKPCADTGMESRGSRVASYSETPEIGAVLNERLKSISAMPQYIDTSHEELRLEEYELLNESSFPCQNQGNAFQPSSSPFGPHTCPVPSSQSSTGGAFSSSHTNSVLGTSSGFRTSPIGFAFAPPSERPSVSLSAVSTSPGFGTLTRSCGGCLNNPVSNSGISFGPSASGSSNNNPVSNLGFSFGPSASGSSNYSVPNWGFSFGPSASGSSNNNPVSNLGFSCGPSASGSSNNPVPNWGFSFGPSASGSSNNNPLSNSGFSFGPSASRSSNNPVPNSGFSFGPSASGSSNNPLSNSVFSFGQSASGSGSTIGIQASSGSQSTSSTRNQGSRVASYSATIEKYQSISAMPSYNGKSHEELRFEDYGLGDKGGQVHCGFPFHNPPLSNQFSVSPFQPFKSTFSEVERGKSVTPSKTISTAPTISPFVNPFAYRPVTDFFWPNWNPPSLIPCTEPMHTKSFEFPKTFPSSSVGSFPFTKPSVIFSPSIQSTTVTSSDSLPSTISPSKSFEFPKTFPSSSVDTFPFPKPVIFSPSIQSTPVTSSDSLPSTVSPSKSFEFPKTFPSSSVDTFLFPKPVIFSPSIQSTPTTSSDSLPSIVSPSQPQQTAEKVGFFPFNDLNKSSQAKYQGSRVTPYSATTETESETYTMEYIGNIQSISAVPSYKDKSHEELRLEDNRVGDKGGTTASTLSPSANPLCCTEHTNIESSKLSVFPSPSVGTFSFTKPLSVQSTPVTSSNPCSSTVNESQPQQAAERLRSLPTDDLHKKTLDSSGWTSMTAFTSLKTYEQYAPPSNLTIQPPLVVNPFATQLPVDQSNAVTSRLHGISSLPVSDNQISISLLRIQNVSSRLLGLPTRKPNDGKTKVPFFIDEEDKLGSVAPFMPRENPRDLVNGVSLSLHSPQDRKDDEVKESSSSFQLNENSTRLTDDTASQHDEASDATGRYVADVLALLPKLPEADYYIKPSLLELAAREMAEAGFCSRVKDFVVGRKGYGSIKFIGETDVRHLDIESIVQFKDREVTIYPDEGKKPPVGQQLNKEAEVTLLNVKCIDLKTGKQYVEGHQVQSYQEALIKRIEEQGVEFVSYDPVEGEWKVMVQHF